MQNPDDQLLHAIETHSAEGIREALASGLDPREPVRGKTAVRWLTEMYTRSDRFPECLRLLLDAGGVLDDPALTSVLLDDAGALADSIRDEPALVHRRTNLVSAFTPLTGATPLHVACEFGHLNAARVLIEAGADIDARADLDEHGLNGHTPLFHTVNSNANRSLPLLRLLLESGAAADVRLAGIVWGGGFEWETVCFDVTPVSYAQLGLLPQMHRRESDVYANIRLLLQAAGRKTPPLENVPNRYLKSSAPG